MSEKVFKSYVYPVALMAGSIIGVGFFSLPYITLKVGFPTMLFYFCLITALMTLLHVMFARISLKTPDYKRFPGFVGFHLGYRAKQASLVLMILGSFGVLLVYAIIGGQFLGTALRPFLGGQISLYVLVYWLFALAIIYFGVKTISRLEYAMLILLIASLALIAMAEFNQLSIANLFTFLAPSGNWVSNLFLPYGALLFSLWGVGLIPEVEEMLKGNKKLLIKVIIISTLLVAAIYLAFICLILAITGKFTTESALVGLQGFLGQKMALLAIGIGLLTTFTATIAQGMLLKKTLMYDMNMSEFSSWLITGLVPLALFFLGLRSFLSMISFLGGVVLGINGILIAMMYRKIGGKKWLVYFLEAIFVLGIIYEITYFI